MRIKSRTKSLSLSLHLCRSVCSKNISIPRTSLVTYKQTKRTNEKKEKKSERAKQKGFKHSQQKVFLLSLSARENNDKRSKKILWAGKRGGKSVRERKRKMRRKWKQSGVVCTTVHFHQFVWHFSNMVHFSVNFGEWKWVWVRTREHSQYTKTATMALLRVWATREMKLVYLNKFGYISASCFFSLSHSPFFVGWETSWIFHYLNENRCTESITWKNPLTFTSEPEKPTNCSQIYSLFFSEKVLFVYVEIISTKDLIRIFVLALLPLLMRP